MGQSGTYSITRPFARYAKSTGHPALDQITSRYRPQPDGCTMMLFQNQEESSDGPFHYSPVLGLGLVISLHHELVDVSACSSGEYAHEANSIGIDTFHCLLLGLQEKRNGSTQPNAATKSSDHNCAGQHGGNRVNFGQFASSLQRRAQPRFLLRRRINCPKAARILRMACAPNAGRKSRHRVGHS